MRFALQCLAAAAASLGVPLAISVLSAGPVTSAELSIDDGPERAATLFLFASPLFLVCLAMYFAFTAILLRYIGQISLQRLLVIDLVLATVVAVMFAGQGFSAFGARDAAISFALFGLLSFASLSVGSVTWWLLQSRTTQSA